MKTSLQKRTKCESPKTVYKPVKGDRATASPKSRFTGMSNNLEKAEPLHIPGYKIRG